MSAIRHGRATMCWPQAVRVVHWNVRRCRDLADECSVARVVHTLAELRPSLLSLNELDVNSTPELLPQLSVRCGLPYSSFFGHVRGTYGNALLSAEPLREVEHVHLDGGTAVVSRDGRRHRIARGMLGATVRVAGVHLRLGVTHLDHICDRERTVQLEHALRSLGGDGGGASGGGRGGGAGGSLSGGAGDGVSGGGGGSDARRAHGRQLLLLGDLNALGRHDYTPDEWCQHEQHNSRRGWAPPTDAAAQGGSIWRLRQAGFIDAYHALHSDPGRRPVSPPWTAHVRTATGPRYRIDYMWSRPPEAGLFLEPCSGFVELKCGFASDHQPVVVDFEPRLQPR